ncbi:MAG: site-specific integrase [Fibrobacteraceae bacterium]|nr:site-specific integrase [Fibrobacteraceae bacterium]
MTEWNRLSIVQRHKSRGIKTWYLRENSDGKISYRSLGTKNKRTAEACLQRLLVLRFRIPGECLKTAELKEMIDKFLSRPSLKKNSIDQYLRILNDFYRWCVNHKVEDALKFNVEHAKDFYNSLSGKSAKHKCQVCGVFLNWVYRECKIEKNHPFKFIEYKPTEKRIRDAWSKREIQLIIENAPTKEMRVLWALMAYAGLRIQEALSLKQENVLNNTISLIGKGNKYATLPISHKLAEELKRFGSLEQGIHITKEASIRTLIKVCKKIGLKGWASNHKFRHSYATNLALSGCPVAIAMRLLRHSSSSMTLDVYTHILSDELKKWNDRAFPRDIRK